jgi:hypothetical protein
MPDIIVGTGTALLRLATSQFDRGLSDAKRRMERFASQSVTAKLGLAAPIATLAAAGASLGGLAFSAKEAMSMETMMVRLGRATGLEGGKLKGLGDQFKAMAGSMPGTDLSKIFGIGTFAAKLGIEGPALAMFTRDVAKMSVVMEDIPLDELTTKMARLLNLFKLGPSDALGLASAINALDISSTASAREILDLTSNMSGMAKTLKLTLPQTLSLAAAMKEANIGEGTGGTAMSQLLRGMRGSKEAGFAKVAGMDRGKFGGLVDTAPFEALKAFFASLSKMDARQQIKSPLHRPAHLRDVPPTGPDVRSRGQVRGPGEQGIRHRGLDPPELRARLRHHRRTTFFALEQPQARGDRVGRRLAAHHQGRVSWICRSGQGCEGVS